MASAVLSRARNHARAGLAACSTSECGALAAFIVGHCFRYYEFGTVRCRKPHQPVRNLSPHIRTDLETFNSARRKQPRHLADGSAGFKPQLRSYRTRLLPAIGGNLLPSDLSLSVRTTLPHFSPRRSEESLL